LWQPDGLESGRAGAHISGMVMDNFPLWALVTIAIFTGSIMAAKRLDTINSRRRRCRKSTPSSPPHQLARRLRAITLHNRRLLSLIWIAITVGALLYMLIAIKGGLRLLTYLP
jgi:beta-lactamase regulating signal transducer with metallopeptidase domain